MNGFPTMKRALLTLCLFSITLTLNGCGGYARSSQSSGVQVYGTVDAGISHESR
ncbi:MAG TPA: hypothetical protein VHL60_01490 [Oxalicibacterium sp.]|nr:hypothetical protein [Oxalicibacterium sp.]